MTSVLEQVLAAKKPSDLFGDKDAGAAKPIHRRLLKQVHPDLFEPQHRARAEQAVANLNTLWDQLTKPKSADIVITTKRYSHTLGELHARGDICNVYLATSDGAKTVVKLPRSPKNSDLVVNEAKVLKKINAEVSSELRAFYPELLDVFKQRDESTKIERRGVVMTLHKTGFVTLTDVRKKFPQGIDPRDMAWMFRRLLIALGGLHDIGVVHGAVVPDHMLMELSAHGFVLVDYSYASTEGSIIPAFAKGWEKAYPDEVGVKLTPTPATDLYMAAKVLEYGMGEQAPRQLRAFVKGCTVGTQANRPGNAWELLAEFTELIERLYGPRRFRVFRLPN